LGLSQYHISDEKRKAPQEAISQGQIPSIEIQHIGISGELAEKLTIPIGTICGIIGTDENATQQVVVSKPNILFPNQKPVVFDHTFPLLQIEASHQFVIPDTTRVRFPESSPMEYVIPQITLPSIADVPCADIQTVSVPHDCISVTSVPHFGVNVPEAEFKATDVEIPNIKSFAQIGQKTEHDRNFAEISQKSRQIPGYIAVPDVPTASIPTVAVPSVSISIPKISKAPMMNAPQVSATHAASVTIPAATKDMKNIHKKLATMNLSRVTELKSKKEASIIAHIPLPTRRVAASSIFPEIALPKQQITVPNIPSHSTMKSIKIDSLTNLNDIAVPVMPNIEKERENILAAAVR